MMTSGAIRFMAEIIGGKRCGVGEEKQGRGECPEMICAESEKVASLGPWSPSAHSLVVLGVFGLFRRNGCTGKETHEERKYKRHNEVGKGDKQRE